jgi:hypothetical protein
LHFSYRISLIAFLLSHFSYRISLIAFLLLHFSYCISLFLSIFVSLSFSFFLFYIPLSLYLSHSLCDSWLTESNRAKERLIATGHKPNNDTYIPIVANLTRQCDGIGLALIHKEMQAHHIVRDAYTRGHGKAVAALAQCGDISTCEKALHVISQSQGTLGATQALNAAIGLLSVQGLVQACSNTTP